MVRQFVDNFLDQFHQLERALFALEEKQSSSIVQFTASNSGEGVTTMTAAFAVFLAGLHGSGKVIAVDANLRNPALSTVLGLECPKSGIQPFEDSQKLAGFIERTGEYGFDTLSVGRLSAKDERSSYESRLEGLRRILGELKSTYRYVLLDSPPVIPFIDSSIIAGMVDRVVLVIASNETRSEVVSHAIGKLRSSRANLSGIVLNRREFFIPDWVYRFL